jgi:hypothetical protein
MLLAQAAGSVHTELMYCCVTVLLCRYWVGPCAGAEWLVRYLPLGLQDWLVYRSMGLVKLEPVLKSNAAALRGQQG